MKKDIHPNYIECSVECTCGTKFTTNSTVKSLKIDICSKCHPFFTGNERFVDATGRVDKFQKRFNWDAQKAGIKS
ncbi:MAG: 50S ribosomal protein L31 [Planctomycetes bacterium]|nr:50S ribosomal protein L31 [Planctomycetota bacterium]